MNEANKILELVDQYESTDELAKALYRESRQLAIYAIGIGIERIKFEARKHKRRAIKREIEPQFVKSSTAPHIKFSNKCRQRIYSNTTDLFDEWKIGARSIGDFTGDELLMQAAHDEASGKGHITNARFHRALAAPILGTTKTVRQHWDATDVRRLKKTLAQKTKELELPQAAE